MITELQSSIGSDVLMGLAQAAGAIALCAAVVVLCRGYAVRVEREAAVSMARGLVQMVLVGMVLAVLLHGSLLIGSLILLIMTVAAAVTAARRIKGMDGALLLCFWSIAAGAGTVIAVMLATRSLRPDISMLVPVGSMIIANTMNACAQAVERFRAEIVAPCWSDRSGPLAGRGACGDGRALSSERRLRQPSASARHAEVSRSGVDSGCHGRHDGFGR